MSEESNPYEVCQGCYFRPSYCKCNDGRTFMGQPIRWTTKHRHADKISIDEFVEMIRDCALGWKSNLEDLNHDNKIELYPEQWAGSLLGWMEIETK